MNARQYAARVALTVHQAMPAWVARPLAQAAVDRIMANRARDPHAEMCAWERRRTLDLIDEAMEETPDACAWLIAAFDRAASLDEEMDTEALAEAIRCLGGAHAAMIRLRASVRKKVVA